jgi:uncharacterized protein (TIGR02145 family)
MFKLGLFPHGVNAPTKVTIGTQVWSTNNLNVITYRNGDPIVQATSNAEWVTYNNTNVACYASVNYDSANDALYGKLYNGWAIKEARNLAPNGFHIATDGEWQELNAYLSNNSLNAGALKEVGASPSPGARWNSPNTLATNSTGFTATGTGRITGTPLGAFTVFQDFGNLTNFAVYDQVTTDMGLIQLDSPTANFGYFPSSNIMYAGISVRCVPNSSLVPGQQFGGGYYVNTSGLEAKVIYPSTSYGSYLWGCSGTNTNSYSTTDGLTNTINLKHDYFGCTEPPFKLYNSVFELRFKDWYVPAVDELLYALNNVNIIQDTSLSYWTSTEDSLGNPHDNAIKVYYDGSIDAWASIADDKSNANEYLLFRRHTL